MPPPPFAPIWKDAPSRAKTQAAWIFALIVMGLLAALAYGVAHLASTDGSWVPLLLAALFLGPGAFLFERFLSADSRKALTAVEAMGLGRLERRTLAIVAAAAPTWTEVFVRKEPLDVVVLWQDAPTGMAVARIKIQDGTGTVIHSLRTDVDELYGLRLLPWPEGAQPVKLGSTYEEYSGYNPNHAVFSVHLPPLTAHNRLALAAAGRPGMEEFHAEMAVHRPDDSDALTTP